MRGAKNSMRPNNTVAAALPQASHSPCVIGQGNVNSMTPPKSPCDFHAF